MVHFPNRRAAEFVTDRLPFTTSNGTIFGGWTADEKLYVVYSYGPHHPLYLYDAASGVWYGNQTRRSVTTSRHYTQARPVGADVVASTTAELRAIINTPSN